MLLCVRRLLTGPSDDINGPLVLLLCVPSVVGVGEPLSSLGTQCSYESAALDSRLLRRDVMNVQKPGDAAIAMATALIGVATAAVVAASMSGHSTTLSRCAIRRPVTDTSSLVALEG